MTWAGKLVALFPVLLFAMMIAAALSFLFWPGWLTAVLLLFAVYFLPVLIYRIHHLVWPLEDSITDIQVPRYSPWWTSYQIQMVYIAIPFLEAPIHLVPGLFSVWLRLWGSEIGRAVFWTPRVDILDRGLLIIGDGATIGHLVAFSGHAISPVEGRLSLIVQKIRIGKGAFIGAESRLGPGSVVADGQMLKAQSVLYWKGSLR